MLAVIFAAFIVVVLLFVAAIVISISGSVSENRRQLRRLRSKLDRHIEANMSPEEQEALFRNRRENSERKQSLFEHGV